MTPTTKDNRPKQLWEIYVPTMRKSGKPIRTRHHQNWDNKVKRITKGLTIHKPVVGIWDSDQTGIEYRERMIPVKIMATRDEMDSILRMTFKHYPDEEAFFYYCISDDVHIAERRVYEIKY